MPPPGRDYTRFLRLAGLRGARIGIPRAGFYRAGDPARHRRRCGRPQRRSSSRVMEEAIAILKREGAEIVDPADIPSYVDGTPANNFNTFPICAGPTNNKGNDAGLLDGVQVRHEARLQPVAGVARRRAPR